MDTKDYMKLLKINVNTSYDLYDKKNADLHKVGVQDPKDDLTIVKQLIRKYRGLPFTRLRNDLLYPYRKSLRQIVKSYNNVNTVE